VLARIDRGPSPAFISAITSSSHTPYVDPRGRAPKEEHVWEYVQEELWWLYGELQRRRFFENGVLIITGDHRKMQPVSQAERDRYGDGAKARIPLLVMGAGVPRGMVDDRLFQQSDLLRMFDRALIPGEPLSLWATWVDRYIYVFGVASNAGNVEIFHQDDMGGRSSRLNLRGAEIIWLARPPNALEIERSIHRQRASLQAERAARVTPEQIAAGRVLEPTSSHGILIGVTADAKLNRDPDEPTAGLRLFESDTLSLEENRVRAEFSAERPFTLTARAFLQAPVDGEYWFSMFADDAGCLAVDGQTVLGCQPGVNEGVALLTAGVHRVDLRYVHRGGTPVLRFRWMPPGAQKFEDFPAAQLLLPAPSGSPVDPSSPGREK
jgi:hypothetical protein